MALQDLTGLARGGELLEGEGAGRFEQPVAQRLAGIGPHQRLLHQRRQLFEHRPLVLLLVGAHRLRQLHGEAAGKHAELAEHGALSVIEQRVAPLHRRAQGLVPAQRGSCSRGEQQEALAHAGVNGMQPQHRHARRCELDGQRQPVELPAQIDHQRHVGLRDFEAGRSGAHARLEQKQRAVAADPRHGSVAGHGQRLEAALLFGPQAQRLLAGGQHAQRRCALQQPVDEVGDGLEQVLAVVEHEQHLATCQRIDEGLEAGLALRNRHAELLRHGMRQKSGVGEAGELDPPCAVALALDLGAGNRLGKAALADAAGADHGDEPVQGEQAGEQHQVVVAADQIRSRRRQVGPGPAAVARGRGGASRVRPGFGDARRIVMERRDEAIAAPRHGGDGPPAQKLAQAADVHRQVVLFDHHGRPDDVEQLALGDHAVAPLHQSQQQVECAGSHLAVLAADAQQSFRGVELGVQEAIGRGCHLEVRSGPWGQRVRRSPA